MFEAYRRYADFQGRASRSEYWLFFLLVMLVMVGSSVLIYATGGPDGVFGMLVSLVYLVFILGSLVPSLAVAFRRLHDTNRSAWWLLIGLLPFIGAIVLIVFYCLPGTPGENRFGPSPESAKKLQETFA
jgi:uncharacterized membrane protein YhaH (DUF805 family)